MGGENGRYEPPNVPGARWRDDLPRWHGPGREYVFPGRRVLLGIWPADRPEECEHERIEGVWVFNDQLLICPGCGLDCT